MDYIKIKGSPTEDLLAINKYKNMCGAQKRRIAYLLGSPNACPICKENLQYDQEIIPMPHYMYQNDKTEHDLKKGRCRVIKWAMGCPQILKESDPDSKLQSMITEGIIKGCPESCNLQFPHNYNEGSEPNELCKINKCQNSNRKGILQNLQTE